VRQETFARVFSVLRKDGLRQPERLGAFVNTVCSHVLSEHYRSTSGGESLDVEGRPELPDKSASALEIVVSRQVKDKVREILLELAPRDRSLLKAVFLDERNRDEYAWSLAWSAIICACCCTAPNRNSRRICEAAGKSDAAGRECLKD